MKRLPSFLLQLKQAVCIALTILYTATIMAQGSSNNLGKDNLIAQAHWKNLSAHPRLFANNERIAIIKKQDDEVSKRHLGTAVTANPTKLKGFAKSTDDEYVLITVKPNQPFTYFVGAGWEGAGRFKINESWQKMMNESANWKALNSTYKK